MSRNTRNTTEPPLWVSGSRWTGPGNGSQGDRNRVPSLFPQFPTGIPLSASGGLFEPWLPMEGRIIARPLSLSSFPNPHRLPLQIVVLDPRTTRPLPSPPPRPTEQQRRVNIPEPTQQGDPSPRQADQSNVTMNLRKEVYNPAPKRLTKRVSLYYRDNPRNAPLRKGKEEENEDGKSCAICLDDFEAKQLVMVTPCNHMFHEDCILPWVKSNGKCPVCRFVICDRTREPMGSNLNGGPTEASGADLLAELMTFIQTME